MRGKRFHILHNTLQGADYETTRLAQTPYFYRPADWWGHSFFFGTTSTGRAVTTASADCSMPAVENHRTGPSR
ncbi:hypothetical protein, partial [Xylella fastidiosa]|uniref:hypothetical protein n=1 Tax=Xylella fastidiosa TaxID=2371 RepID=UPI001EE9E589